MSYLALARKWRPQNFAELVGQEHIKRALTTALDSGRVHHAFLFTGTRGVGKTTIARIIAKCLNCEQGVTATPCGTCPNCQAITDGRFVDLLEVDAASRTRVDDTRELLDNVQYRPTQGRYKVYLIDEVHMLSTHSFNALLKTLEEPPEHVVFLLATTDPQKLPVTVLSRCLQFHLRHLAPEEIAQHLADILRKESVHFEDGALHDLAEAAQGSMRDALSLLDQAIAHGAGKITTEGVRQMLGCVERAPVHDLLEALWAGDGDRAFECVEQFEAFSSDFLPVVDAIIHILHELAIIQVVPSRQTDVDEQVARLAETVNPEWVQLMYDIALRARRDLPLAPTSRIGFEMLVLRMLAFSPEPKSEPSRPTVRKIQSAHISAKSNRINGDKVKGNAHVTDEEVDPASQVPVSDVVETVPEPQTGGAKVNPEDITPETWPDVARAMPLSGPAQQIILHCVWGGVHGKNVRLYCRGLAKSMFTDRRLARIQEAIAEVFGKTWHLDLIHEQTEIPEGETAAQRRQKELAQRQAEAEVHVATNPLIQGLVKQFDGKVRPGSVRPTDETSEPRNEID